MLVRAVTAFITTVLVGGCGGASPGTTEPAADRTGAPATDSPAGNAPAPLPALAFPGLDGDTWRAADARGRVLVVDVWASWCGPCRKGFLRINALAQRYPDVRFVAISIDEDEQAVRAFLDEVAVDVPVALDREQSLTEPPLAVTHVPTVLVVDPDGRVRLRLREPTAEDYDELDRVVAALVGSS